MAERRFRKGDHVKFEFGTRILEGVVKEDRGPIGVKGRRLYLVEFWPTRDSETPSEVELPAVEMTAVEGAASTD
jgi:hypothetical protein